MDDWLLSCFGSRQRRKKKKKKTYNHPLIDSPVVETIHRTYSSSSRLIGAIAVPAFPDVGVLCHSGQHSTANLNRRTHLASEYKFAII